MWLDGLYMASPFLAQYAALCQEAGMVPIVEPEVLMDGDHDIDRCYAVSEWVLKETFQELYYNRVALEGMVLKPNMAVPGKKSGKRAGRCNDAARRQFDGPRANFCVNPRVGCLVLSRHGCD
jgi:fructose-bisphosphate aldolase class 1